MKQTPELSIIIVSWNCWDYLELCLKSLNSISNLSFEVLIIDNNSEKKPDNELLTKYSFAHYIFLSENIGFAAANNIGFKEAKGDYLLALNPDTELFHNSLEVPLKYLKNNFEYGCVGLKQLKSNGKINFNGGRTFPTLRGSIFSFLFIDKLFPKLECLKSPDLTYWDHNTDRDINLISGAFMLFPRLIYEKIGGLSTEFRMYFEDLEFCYRIRNNGYKIKYLAEASYIHHFNQSAKKSNLFWITNERNNSLFHFLALNQSIIHARFYKILIPVVSVIRIFLLPIISFALYIKNGNGRCKFLFLESCATFLWSFSLKRKR